MQKPAAYVILEWLDANLPHPRYSFATAVHAAELGDAVRWVEPCDTMAMAAALVSQLNAKESGAMLHPRYGQRAD